jgi:sec-independent protein translocase protein TatB
MLEVGWTEMLVIAIVMIVVVGPKDLPRMLRTFGRTTAKLRQMAGDFQKQFNEALQEAELDEVKKSVDNLRSLNPATEIKKQLNPFEKAAADVRAGLDSLKPQPPKANEPAPTATEPLKNGATAMPEALAGVSASNAEPAAAAPEPKAVASTTPAPKPTTTAKSKPAPKAAASAAKQTTAAGAKAPAKPKTARAKS